MDHPSTHLKHLLDSAYFYFMMMTYFMIPTRVVLGVSGVAVDGGLGGAHNPILQLANGAAMVCTALMVYPKVFQILTALRHRYILGIMTLDWLISSLVLYRPDFPFQLPRYILMLTASVVFISLEIDSMECIRLLNNFILCAALASVPATFILPSMQDLIPGWQGVFMQKSEMGACMALGIILLILDRRKWTLFKIGHMAILVSMLVLSKTATADICTIFCIVYLWSLRVNALRRLVVICTGFLSAILTALIIDQPVDKFLNLFGRDDNFTGRLPIWTKAIQGIAEKPLFGYGPGVYWEINRVNVDLSIGTAAVHAHNGILQLMLDVGLIGTVIVLIFLWGTYRKAQIARRLPLTYSGIITLVLLVFVGIRSISEAFLLSTSPFWFLLVLFSLYCSQDLDQHYKNESIEQETPFDETYSGVQ